MSERLQAFFQRFMGFNRSTRAMVLLGASILTNVVGFSLIVAGCGYLYEAGYYWAQYVGGVAIILIPGLIGTMLFQGVWLLGVGLPGISQPVRYLILLNMAISAPLAAVIGASIVGLVDFTFFRFFLNFPIQIIDADQGIGGLSPTGIAIFSAWIVAVILLAITSLRWNVEIQGKISTVVFRSMGNVMLTLPPAHLLAFQLFVGGMAITDTWI